MVMLAVGLSFATAAPGYQARVPNQRPSDVAESELGSVHGHVTDPSGAVAPHASIVAIPREGNSRTSATDQQGIYTLPDLPPGVYTVVVQLPGFAEAVKPNIHVSPGQNLALDFQLSVVEERNSGKCAGTASAGLGFSD